MTIGFNHIPGSGLVAPLMAFEVNSAGHYESSSRLMLVGFQTAAGIMAHNVPTICTSQGEADALAGPGSMLREMYRMARKQAPAQDIWLTSIVEVGVAPVWTLTLADIPENGGVGVLYIDGQLLTISIAAGDDAASVAATLAAAINGYYADGTMLLVTAEATGAVVTATARHKGAILNEINFFVPKLLTGNDFVACLTIATATPGSGAPAVTSATAAIGDDPADMVISAFPDDAALDAFEAWLSDQSGRWAWSRQVYGHHFVCRTGTTAEVTTLGLGRNDRHATIIPRPVSAPEPSWLWAAGFGARVLPWLSDCVTGNVSRNQTGLIVEGLKAPRDRAQIWGYAGRNALLQSGISTWTIDKSGHVAIDKLVTSSRTGLGGEPDTVFQDIQSVYQVAGSLKFLLALLHAEHGQKSIMDENPGGLEAVVTPSEVRATFIHGYTSLNRQGVVENLAEFTERVDVRRNPENPRRFDFLLPIDRVNPADIFAGNAKIYAQYR